MHKIFIILIFSILSGKVFSQNDNFKDNSHLLTSEDIINSPLTRFSNLIIVRNDSNYQITNLIEIKKTIFGVNKKIRHGKYIEFNENGKLNTIGTFKNNRKTGIWIIFEEDYIGLETWKKNKIIKKSKNILNR